MKQRFLTLPTSGGDADCLCEGAGAREVNGDYEPVDFNGSKIAINSIRSRVIILTCVHEVIRQAPLDGTQGDPGGHQDGIRRFRDTYGDTLEDFGP